VRVLAVLIILVALVIIIVPQFTNCEYGQDYAAALVEGTTGTDSVPGVTYAAVQSPEAAAAMPAAMPYRMMKCYWSAHAEIVAGVPLLVIGVLLFFARRKETTRALGALTAALGVLVMLIPTSIIGTCLNAQMVCNTEMKPTLFIAGGVTIALGVAVLVVGELRRESSGDDGARTA
jgi:CHASE2 domain-containing sensor protein